MKNIKAIGFDLFNTLITVHPDTLERANESMVRCLLDNGLYIERDSFRAAYRAAALRFLEESKRSGRETHNRYWIGEALKEQGHPIDPTDPSIEGAVESYFSAFYPRCTLLPGTMEMLGALKNKFRLGLLSNFTHAPAAEKIIGQLELEPFFDPILISGALGYRKPHPTVFSSLVASLGCKSSEILFVGDDLEADVSGALNAGLWPVWSTCVQDQGVPSATGILQYGTNTPVQDVPRISSWEDLILLLEYQ